jgi:DNA (cytosine-5)-methyltransferase 1
MTTLPLGPYVDLFAGPGGWDTGIRDLGVIPLGIEWDDAACETARAAGHSRMRTDVAAANPAGVARLLGHGGVRGLIASPPCQGFSTAGKGKSRDDSEHLLKRLADVHTRTDLEDAIRDLTPTMTDPRTLLVLEPLRWALALTPSWLAWEQVPGVLPLWEACADVLRRIGYTVATGVLSAEQYGVPQTRRRAILVARAPWFTREHGPATLPPATHSRYYSRDPQRLDPGVLPWVSMASALGRGMTARPSMTVTGGGTGAGGAEPFGHGARDGMLRELEAGRWVQRSNYSTGSSDGSTAAERGRTERALDLPSTTVTSKGFQWRPEFNDQSGTPFDPTWPEQPATAVAGRGLVQNPGATANRYNGSTKSRNDGVRVTVQEAAILQSFPADYPWQGKSGAQYRQVGDAVPPLLARAIVKHVAAIDD